MRGTAEHSGNRNYFGQERIDAAPQSPIHRELRRVARVRAATPALQRGLQVNVEMRGDRAVFYRVLQADGVNQIALVLLNKGDAEARFDVRKFAQAGTWRSAFDGREATVAGKGGVQWTVPAHGVEVLLLDAPVQDKGLLRALRKAQKGATPRG